MTTAKALDCHVADFSRLAGLDGESGYRHDIHGRRERLLNADMVLAALKARRYKPAYLLDLAVPGDIDPAINRIDEAFLYDLSELNRWPWTGLPFGKTSRRGPGRFWKSNSGFPAWPRGTIRRSRRSRFAPFVRDRAGFRLGRIRRRRGKGDQTRNQPSIAPADVRASWPEKPGRRRGSVAEWDLTGNKCFGVSFDLSPDAVDLAKREDENNGS